VFALGAAWSELSKVEWNFRRGIRKRGQNSGKKYIDYDRILGRANGSDTNERRWILIAQYWFRLSCLEHHFSGEFGRRAEPGKNR
jgi:hypothetical protein|tara:strand:+ start:212 stop:466 length:255 start_codon:yes stop_codon:yes gene_type:complete